MKKIDFVLLWVDDSDPKWKAERNAHQGKKVDESENNVRFRDWDNLKYWFRGVETFAPWINNIYFITYGHLPKWLNINHPKLKIIKHEDYIPKQYLPTFNSNVIELNLNRIEDLSENFVLFNDDMFIIDDVQPTLFFENGLPKYECVEEIITGSGGKDKFAHTLINNMDIINRNFSKKETRKNNFKKHINIKYGLKKNVKTLLLWKWEKFCGFYNFHLPMPHLKSTFNEVWSIEKDCLDEVCFNKFRKENDISHWTFQYWNFCKNKFIPCNLEKEGKYFDVNDTNALDISKEIKNQNKKIICINDSKDITDFDRIKTLINGSFEEVLPNKSKFEL